MKHIKKMKIDIDKKNYEVISSVQYDNNTRFLHINLQNGNEPLDITGCSVKISATKPDGTAVFNNCNIINAKEGFIEVELTEQINAAPGNVSCEIKIYDRNGVLTTKQFYIDVTASVTSKNITSGNEFKALEEALSKVNNIDTKFESLTAETVKAATEKEIQKQIASGNMANLAIAPGSITKEKLDPNIKFGIEDGEVTNVKLANKAVSDSKLSQQLQADINLTRSLINQYKGEGTVGDVTLKTFGTRVVDPSYNGKTIDYSIKSGDTSNSAVYFMCNEIDIVLSDITTATFIVLNVTNEYVYSYSPKLKVLRKHGLTGSTLQSVGVPLSGTFNVNIPIKFKNDGDNITIIQSDVVMATISRADYGEYLPKDSLFGFLITQSTSLKDVKSINPNIYNFNIANKDEVDAMKTDIINLKNLENRFERFEQDMGGTTTVKRALTIRDYSKIDCIESVNSDGGVFTKNQLLTAKYDWFYTDSHIKEYEVTHGGGDTWIVIKQKKDSVIAFSTGGSMPTLKTFSNESAVNHAKAVLEKDTSVAPTAGETMLIREIEPNIFTCEILKQGSAEYKQFIKIDISVIPSFADYDLGYGLIVHSNNIGKMVYRTSSGLVEENGILSLKNDIENNKNDIENNKNDIENNKKEIKQLKEVLAQGGGTGTSNSKIVDLVMFMGQSNMAGRGVAAESPVVPVGHGYEFRAISDPTKLYNIVEPFGVNENNPSSGVSESSKTGSMVSSFVKAYYEATKTPVVAVSCAKGGTRVSWWQPGGGPLNDAINRHNLAKTWLENNGYIIRNDFMVWCQGCSDGDVNLPAATYQEQFKKMVEEMMKHGIQKCFMVRIGNHRDDPTKYDEIISAQTELGKTYKNVVLVSTKFDSMASDGLMKDQFHYKQEGYNITGRDAGINTAFYIKNLKEPTMFDWENQNLYYSHKN